MSTIASQITSLTIVYSTVYSGADQRKHQSSASLAFVWGIHRGPVNSPRKWPVTRKLFPFDDVIMSYSIFLPVLCCASQGIPVACCVALLWWNQVVTQYPTQSLSALIVLCLTMMTSSNGNIFRVTGPMCGEFTGPGDFPAQRPATRSFDVFFDLRLYKRLSKQRWGWWFETTSWSLWR